MRRMIVATLLAATAVAAQANPHGGYHHPHGGVPWIVPLIVGVGVGYAVTRDVPPPPPQVIYVPAPPPQQRPMIKRVDVFIPECNCTRTIEVQIQ